MQQEYFVIVLFAVPYLCTGALITAAIIRACKPESRLAKSRLLGWLVGAAQIFLGLIIFTGGMSKLMPFFGVMGPVWLEERLAEHGLGLFARFIAWSETVIGLLLLTRRFAVLGAIMLVPLLVNMLMVTISMQWQGTPIVLGFFCLLNVLLLAYRYDAWKSVLHHPPVTRSSGAVAVSRQSLALTSAGLALCLIGPAVFSIWGSAAYFVVAAGSAMVGIGEFWRRSN